MNVLQKLKLGQYVARKWVKQMFVYPQQKLSTNALNYDDYWDSKRPQGHEIVLSPSERTRADIIASAMHGDAQVIGDIGSGPGVVLKAILDKHPDYKGIAFDSSVRALETVTKLGIEASLLDITKPHAINAVPECDYFIILEVLEHIPNSEEILVALMKKARKGVFFSVPNTGFLTHRFRLLFGKAPAQWIHMPNEHLRFWTIRDMRWWVRALGFTRYTVTPYLGVPGLNKVWPNLFAMGMVVFVASGE